MSVTVERTFETGIIFTVISNRSPSPEGLRSAVEITVCIKHVLIYHDVRHKSGVYVLVTLVYVLCKPIKLACIGNFIYVTAKNRGLVSVADGAEAVIACKLVRLGFNDLSTTVVLLSVCAVLQINDYGRCAGVRASLATLGATAADVVVTGGSLYVAAYSTYRIYGASTVLIIVSYSSCLTANVTICVTRVVIKMSCALGYLHFISPLIASLRK